MILDFEVIEIRTKLKFTRFTRTKKIILNFIKMGNKKCRN